MDIRQAGIGNINSQNLNTQKMDFSDVGRKPALPSDTFSSSAQVGEKLISPNLSKIVNKSDTTDAGANTAADVSSPDKQAYGIISANAKDQKEAEADFNYFKSLLEKDMNPAEMAPFFVFGDKFYEKGGDSRGNLIKISLKELNDFIADKSNFYKGTTRQERLECAKMLTEAIPPEDQKHIFGGGDALKPFSYILETLNENKTEKGTFHFGYENIITDFSPPGRPNPGIVETTKNVLGWMKLVQNAPNRKSPEFMTNDDTDAVHTLKIVRSCLHYDPEKTKELESLMTVVGSPWGALGIMIKLDEVNPELREEAKNVILEEALKEGANNEKIAEETTQVTGLYSLMQPGENAGTFTKNLNDIVNKMVENPPMGNLPTYSQMNLVNNRLKLMGKFREKGESITDSSLRFNGFGNKMQAMGFPLKDVKDFERLNDFYRTLGEKKSELLDGIPGTKTYQDVNRNVLGIIDRVWVRQGMPVEEAPDLITVGLQLRKPGQNLEEVCKTLAKDYKSIGDLSDLGEIEKNVEQGMQEGKFKGMDRQKVKEEIIRQYKMQKMMGDRSETTVETAYNDVVDAHTGKPEEKVIEQKGQFVVIGGVRLDVKKKA